MRTFQDPETSDDTRIEPDFPVVSEATEDEYLAHYSAHYSDDYCDFKEDFIDWLLNKGKDPERGDGYSHTTAKSTHYRIEQAYRWLWDRHEKYVLEFTLEDATALIEHVRNGTPHPDSVTYHYEKSIMRLFKYYRNEKLKDIPEWDHGWDLKNTNSINSNHQKDKFYATELQSLYQAALGEYSVKSYNTKSMTPEERQRIKKLISRRQNISMDEIGPKEFEKANSWKIPSLVAVTCDTGLRPIEVEKASVNWFNLDLGQMIIPEDEGTEKNNQKWTCQLSHRATKALGRWLDERETYDNYQDSEMVWLTQTGTTYQSSSLNKLLDRLIERAGIDMTGRNISWYSIRHGVASLWCEKKGIYAARNQLRHQDIDTTLRYSQTGVKDLTQNEGHDSLW